MKSFLILLAGFSIVLGPRASAQSGDATNTLYDVAPRWLIDMPTAGTLPRGHYQIGTRLYPSGGAIGFTDIGLSNRLMIGISYGGQDVVSNKNPNWNPKIEFNLRFRPIDEIDYFPAVTFGFSSQGQGYWNTEIERYTFKSRGFYGVVSRSFYFYQWTAGWHAGVNYSLENTVDDDKALNFFLGFDATFKYNLAFLIEYDAALNDDRSTLPDTTATAFAGKGRGYMNMSLKWLFTENLELEALVKDIFVNRRESATITREMRITYIDRF